MYLSAAVPLNNAVSHRLYVVIICFKKLQLVYGDGASKADKDARTKN